MEFSLEKINNLPSLELENCDKPTFTRNQCTSLSQVSKSTSDNSEIAVKRSLKTTTDFFRNHSDLRKSYYQKLQSKQRLPIIGEPQLRKYNSIIIFDWDDTLFCSSYLIKKKFFENSEIPPNIKTKLQKLEQCVYKVLSISIEYGDTYIITNASQGWVEFSAKKYYPSVYPLLEKIHIISARAVFEKDFPDDTRMWKMSAFAKVGKDYPETKITNIICVGDSPVEMEAVSKLGSMFIEAFVKTIKFREEPKPEHIIKQLSLVAKQFNEIHST